MNESKQSASIETPTLALEKQIRAILTTLIGAFIIGTGAMVYSSDRSTRVFETELRYLSKGMAELKSDIKSLEDQLKQNTTNRWTRNDHHQYESRLDQRLQRLENRVLQLEVKNSQENATGRAK